MKEELKRMVEEILEARWPGQYSLLEVLQHEYGYSLVFLNQKTQNRFSPTLIPTKLVHHLLNEKSQGARRVLEREVQTAIVKETFSG